MREDSGIDQAGRGPRGGATARGCGSGRAALLVGLGVWAGSLAPSLSAQSADVREGNRLYAEGRFEEAHERYLEALAADPESGLILFNDGSALYQRADYERALEAYQRAIESGDRELAASAWYNLGNTLYRQQQLQQSLEAYKEALRLAPSDPDAKHNLERVLAQLQQQEQQQQGGEGGEDEQNQQQNPQSGQDQQDPQEQEGEQDAQEDQQQQQPPEGDQDQQPPAEPDPGPGDQPPPEGEGQAEGEPRPEEMTPEEAERLLDAIEEDPSEVDRRRASPLGRQPRKPW